MLRVRENPAAPGVVANDRGEVTSSLTVIDAVGKVFNGTVKITWSVPRTAAWGATSTRDLFAYVRNYITDARVQSLEDGIIP